MLKIFQAFIKIRMQEIENIGKNSGKYGSISFFLILIYIKAMIFLVFNVDANNVLLSVNIGTFNCPKYTTDRLVKNNIE